MTTNNDFDGLSEILGDTEPSGLLERFNVKIDGMTAQQVDETIHALVAKRIAEMIQIPELCTPQFLAQALRFLADNKVTGRDIPERLGAEVREKYADKAPFKLAN